MPTTELTYDALVELTDETDPAELGPALEGQAGGAERVAELVFDHYRDSFVPSRSEGEAGAIQFRVTTSAEPIGYVVEVNDGTCDIHAGELAEPSATLTITLPDLVRMTAGRVNGAVLAMTGRLEVAGDAGTAMNLKEWFATD